MYCELFIEHEGVLYQPLTLEGITWSTERKSSPGQLNFKVVKDSVLNFEEGDAVILKYGGIDVFYGFVFTKKRNKDQVIDVTAYDQLRYLKNKDTYCYENKTASEFIKAVAQLHNLKVGDIEDTKYRIPSRVEKNVTLFDMIENALDLTLMNKTEMYIMYDDFGKITLKGLESMKLDLMIDEETAEDFDYQSTIDSNTYNKVRLAYEKEDSNTIEVYEVKDTSHINKWGLLQYFDTLKEGENGKTKAEALLSLYNSKTRTLSIKNALADIRVRAGSLIVVHLNIGDVILKNYMLVEKCKHTFNGSQHTMDLTVRGGEFIA